MNATIVSIVSIVDTRVYEEQGDRWVPIPGSGVALRCSRCNREHEVHATVALSDGSTAVVGTGCASKESAALAPAFRSGEARAKRVASLEAQIARAQALVAEADSIDQSVAPLSSPSVASRQVEPRRWEYTCGDAKVWGFAANDPERVRCAVATWRGNRRAERGYTHHHASARYALEDLTRKLDRT